MLTAFPSGGAATVLDLILLGIKAIVLFIIDTYRSLYLCLMDVAVHGSLDLLISATDEISGFVTAAFSSARSDIQGAITLINQGLEKTLGLVDDLPGSVECVASPRCSTRG